MMKKVFLSTLALALAAGAAAVPQYSQLRQDYSQIDEAIAAATESDLHGTFNRLSALFNRAPIRDAVADAGFDGSLPANFERNLEATLIDLQEDLLKPQLDGLTPEQKLDILQVVRIYAYRRTIELWQSESFTTCGLTPNPCPIGQECPPPPPCVDDDPAVFNELQDLVGVSRPLYTAAYNSVPPANRGGLTAPSALSASNFTSSVEGVVSIRGVESIDD